VFVVRPFAVARKKWRGRIEVTAGFLALTGFEREEGGKGEKRRRPLDRSLAPDQSLVCIDSPAVRSARAVDCVVAGNSSRAARTLDAMATEPARAAIWNPIPVHRRIRRSCA
jgi:hypothetical protein